MEHALFRCITAGLLVSLFSGCATTEAPPSAPAAEPELVATVPDLPAPPPLAPAVPEPGEDELGAGIAAYENARYGTARKQLQSALNAGLKSADQVTAYKYLAFLACANRQRTLCKKHFRAALAIAPAFTLSPTEAGHPVWGKVFRDVQKESSKSRR